MQIVFLSFWYSCRPGSLSSFSSSSSRSVGCVSMQASLSWFCSASCRSVGCVSIQASHGGQCSGYEESTERHFVSGKSQCAVQKQTNPNDCQEVGRAHYYFQMSKRAASSRTCKFALRFRTCNFPLATCHFQFLTFDFPILS
eukprot:15516_1